MLNVALLLSRIHAQSTTQSTTNLPHHKQFTFDFSSTDKDDLEVDVTANVDDDFDSDSVNVTPYVDSWKIAQGKKASQMVNVKEKFSTEHPTVIESPTYPASAERWADSFSRTETIYSTITTTVYENVSKASENEIYQRAVATNAPVAITPVLSAAAVSQLATPLTTPLTSPLTTPLTTPAADPSNMAQYQQGFNDGYSQAVAHASSGEGAVYTQGYVQGAQFGYEIGYDDASHYRHNQPPVFITGPPPVPLPTPVTTSYPVPLQPQYTTMSYFVPYSGQNPYGQNPYAPYQPYGVDEVTGESTEGNQDVEHTDISNKYNEHTDVVVNKDIV